MLGCRCDDWGVSSASPAAHSQTSPKLLPRELRVLKYQAWMAAARLSGSTKGHKVSEGASVRAEDLKKSS